MDELFRGEYFMPHGRLPHSSISRKQFPAPQTDALAKCQERQSHCRFYFSNGALPGVYHNSCAVLDADGATSANTARCTSPTILSTTRNFISRPAISVFPKFQYKIRAHRHSDLLDQWYPEGSRLTALSGAQVILSDEHRLASAEKHKSARPQLEAWRTISARARLQTAPTSGRESRRLRGDPKNGDPGLEFWGNSFVADPFGQIAAQSRQRKRRNSRRRVRLKEERRDRRQLALPSATAA